MRWILSNSPIRLFLLFSVTGGLLALSLQLYRNLNSAVTIRPQLERSLAVQLHLERYQSSLLQADLRGRTTARPAAPVAMHQSLLDADAALVQLATLTSSDTRQTIRVKMLQHLTAAASTSKQLPDPIFSLPILDTVNQIRKEERNLLQQSVQRTQLADFALWALASSAFFGSLLCVVWVFWSIHGNTTKVKELGKRNSLLEQQLQRSRAELASTIVNLEASQAELERFAYVASHDLQEPLRQVASCNQLLLLRYADALDPLGRHYLNSSLVGAKRLQLMLEGLLGYSLLSKASLRVTQISPSDLANTVCNDLQSEILASGVKITCTVDQASPITGDREMIRKVLGNLLQNAIRFRREHSPTVAISINSRPRSWTLAVLDNGIGIDKRFIGRMFDIFARNHAPGTYPGTGIGLAIVKKIVSLHGGSLKATPNPFDQGSVLTVEIPQAQADHCNPSL